MRGAFDEIAEDLRPDAEILGLAAPLAASRVFDFALQRDVNRELTPK